MSLGRLTKVAVTPSPGAIAELAEHFTVKPEGVPMLVGYYDRRGKLRRIVASYPDGWRCQVNIDSAGYVTSSSARCKLATIKIGGADA
jgi:hypothetical protein